MNPLDPLPEQVRALHAQVLDEVKDPYAKERVKRILGEVQGLVELESESWDIFARHTLEERDEFHFRTGGTILFDSNLGGE